MRNSGHYIEPQTGLRNRKLDYTIRTICIVSQHQQSGVGLRTLPVTVKVPARCVQMYSETNKGKSCFVYKGNKFREYYRKKRKCVFSMYCEDV